MTRSRPGPEFEGREDLEDLEDLEDPEDSIESPRSSLYSIFSRSSGNFSENTLNRPTSGNYLQVSRISISMNFPQ